MSFSISELISYFGGLMGIILSMVSLFASKNNKSIKFSLSALLLVTSLIIVLGTMHFSGKTIHFIHLFRIDSPFHYLLGPVLYFYTLSVLNPNFKYRWIDLVHLLPFVLNFIEFMPFYTSPAAVKLDYYEEFRIKGSVIIPLHYLLKTILFSIYFVAQFFLLKKYRLLEIRKNKPNFYLVSWFLINMSSQLILIFGVFIDHITGLKLFEDPYRFAMTMITFFHYSVVLGLLFIPNLFYGMVSTEKEPKEKYSSSKLSETEKSKIINLLKDFIKRDDKPYLNEKISLTEVSKLLKVSPQHLSQVINEKTNRNFNDFINSYRIEEAKNILISTSFSKLTIDAIAQKAGFNSKSVFYTAFKKHTGVTPKEFITLNSQESFAPTH
jgi:AraC-like DNA-binding protein